MSATIPNTIIHNGIRYCIECSCLSRGGHNFLHRNRLFQGHIILGAVDICKSCGLSPWLISNRDLTIEQKLLVIKHGWPTEFESAVWKAWDFVTDEEAEAAIRKYRDEFNEAGIEKGEEK